MTLKLLAAEWVLWWEKQSAARRYLPAAGAATFLALHRALGGLRADHFQLAGAFLALCYLGPRFASVLRFALPILIVGAVYDAQRYWVVALRGSIHVIEPYRWELKWFGIQGPAGMETPSEWLQLHTRPALDVITGLAYILFIPVFLACCGWWEFHDHRRRANEVMWSMLVLNILAYTTYLIYPAAPPWYVTHYGLGPAISAAPPEPGGGIRFDQLLGVHVFANIYGRNANVFGAIPSLHIGQTFLAVVYSWSFRSLRIVATTFWLLVTFSAVYLNHHYLVDGVLGMLMAAITYFLMSYLFRPSRTNSHQPAGEAGTDEDRLGTLNSRRKAT